MRPEASSLRGSSTRRRPLSPFHHALSASTTHGVVHCAERHGLRGRGDRKAGAEPRASPRRSRSHHHQHTPGRPPGGPAAFAPRSPPHAAVPVRRPPRGAAEEVSDPAADSNHSPVKFHACYLRTYVGRTVESRKGWATRRVALRGLLLVPGTNETYHRAACSRERQSEAEGDLGYAKRRQDLAPRLKWLSASQSALAGAF